MEKEEQEKNFGWIRSDFEQTVRFDIKTFDQTVYLVNQSNEVIEVSPKGSLEIMALGQVGHLAWKKAQQLEHSDG